MTTRTGPVITYHGRSGRPVVHKDTSGREFIMVRKKEGGTKRLYEGSLYYPGPKRKRGRRRRLRL